MLEERRVQLDADARGFKRPIAIPEPQIPARFELDAAIVVQELLDQAGGLAGIDRGVEEALKNGDFVERDGLHAQERPGASLENGKTSRVLRK